MTCVDAPDEVCRFQHRSVRSHMTKWMGSNNEAWILTTVRVDHHTEVCRERDNVKNAAQQRGSQIPTTKWV